VLAQVGIGTNTPNASAQLDVTSTVKGFLPPRMTSQQRDAISSPANGLVIFNTTTNCLNFYVVDGWHEACGTRTYPDGSVFCGVQTAVVNVTNPLTGKIWMDRNLGATQKATSSVDANGYGDLYQWGRRSDGHQCRTPIFSTTGTLSSVDQPADGGFIGAPNAPYDWRSPQNNNLWQGVNGANNPCPGGYRLPTETELNNERLSWATNDSYGALASPLKWTMAGGRDGSTAVVDYAGTNGFYWSSTVSNTFARFLFFNGFNAAIVANNRANGYSVRCIKGSN
ncbi:MAG: hypothetical protein RLZZ557_253, partial [Bacteroidota bacterium]